MIRALALQRQWARVTCYIQGRCVDTKKPFWYLHEAVRTCRPPAGDWMGLFGRISDFFTTLPQDMGDNRTMRAPFMKWNVNILRPRVCEVCWSMTDDPTASKVETW